MEKYTPQNPIRIVTAASLFDGHDASINIMRRIIQDMGAEVIHLGHNRSVHDVVKAVLQEGAQGVCISSYQGGHMEYFKYLRDLLNEAGAGYVRIFGGGGGVIVHEEKKELEAYGISQIFHPDDGRRLGLEGMIAMIINTCDFDLIEAQKKYPTKKQIFANDLVPSVEIGIALTAIENGQKDVTADDFNLPNFSKSKNLTPVLGITGTGGAGKSSLIDEIAQRFLNFYPDKKIGLICVDPSKRKTGGSLLGDRIRMNSLSRPNIYMRSVASRGSGQEIAASLPEILKFMRGLDFDLLIAETSGIGQGNMAITSVSDLSMYVMTSDFGAQSQLEKIDMIDYADFVAVNKADRRGAQDALRDVTKQYKRSRKIFDDVTKVPVFLTQASQFNDGGVNQLFFSIADKVATLKGSSLTQISDDAKRNILSAEEHIIIPSERQNYLAEIVSTQRKYKARVKTLAEKASKLGALQVLQKEISLGEETIAQKSKEFKVDFETSELEALNNWDQLQKTYSGDELVFKVRDKEMRQKLTSTSLSGRLKQSGCWLRSSHHLKKA